MTRYTEEKGEMLLMEVLTMIQFLVIMAMMFSMQEKETI
jgi:hypothetical protein